MITVALIMSFVQVCSPNTDLQTAICTGWMLQCYIQNADLTRPEDEFAFENCSENIPIFEEK